MDRIRFCRVMSNPELMPVPYQPRGTQANQRFITQIGFQLLGNSNFPVVSTISNPNPSFYLFSDNQFENCALGMKIQNSSTSQKVSISNCLFRNNFRGLQTGLGTGAIVNSTFELPAVVEGFFNLTGGGTTISDPRSIGILAQDDLEVSSYRFRNFTDGNRTVNYENKIGIRSELRIETAGVVRINGNTFTDMQTAIDLGTFGEPDEDNVPDVATMNFTLKCNQFRLTCAEVPNVLITDPDPCAAAGTPNRRGLVIGEGVRLRAQNGNTLVPDQIGGQSVFNTNGVAYPNANEWPVRAGIDRANLPAGIDDIQGMPWRKPAQWVTIDNNAANPIIRYHRYFNEFVHNDEDEDVWNAKTPSVNPNVRMTASTGNNPGELACVDFDIDDFDVFPLRVAVLTDSISLLTGTQDLNHNIAWMGDAFPNPSAGEARIKAFIPAEEPIAVIQIIEVATGKVLSGKVMQERGLLELILDCSKAPAGNYIYQLLLSKKSLATKKLTILR